jgi:[ribosomal protein S18]-alanine N-acetyltransferase
MTPTVDVRPMASGDIDAVATTHAACFDDPWSASMIRRILALPGAFGLSAVSASNVLAGFALGRVAVDECELLSIGVAASYRGHGIGAQLLDAVMVWASANDAKKLFLEVAEGNSAALRLYARRGMVQVGRRVEYYELKDGEFVDALTLRCDLARPGQAPRRGPLNFSES